MSDKIGAQLRKQKIKFEPTVIASFDLSCDGLLRLRFMGVLSDKCYEQVRKKIFNKILSHVKKMNP